MSKLKDPFDDLHLVENWRSPDWEHPRNTAPQPEVQLSQQQVIGALERGQLSLLDRIAALEAQLAEAQALIPKIETLCLPSNPAQPQTP